MSVAEAQGGAEYRLLTQNGRVVKWGGPYLGEGASLTYAFAREKADFPDARNCRSVEPVDRLARRMGVDFETLEKVVEQSFDRWRAAANVEFRRTDDVASADILIGADGETRGWAFADVHSRSDGGAVGSIDRALVCVNAERRWKVGFGGRRDAQDLRFTLTHEIGHALGLNHPGPHGQLMSFSYRESFAGLQPGDVKGVQALYGPPARPRPPILAGNSNAGAR